MLALPYGMQDASSIPNRDPPDSEASVSISSVVQVVGNLLCGCKCEMCSDETKRKVELSFEHVRTVALNGAYYVNALTVDTRHDLSF